MNFKLKTIIKNRSIYRKPAPRDPGPTKVEQMKEWLKIKGPLVKMWVSENPGWTIVIGIILALVFFISYCFGEIAKMEEQQKIQHTIHLQEMKKICAPDYYQNEMKIGDDLWQISCVHTNVDGGGRILLQERP